MCLTGVCSVSNASGLKSSVVINIDLTISVKLSFLYIRSVVETEHAGHKKTEKGGRNRGIWKESHTITTQSCAVFTVGAKHTYRVHRFGE